MRFPVATRLSRWTVSGSSWKGNAMAKKLTDELTSKEILLSRVTVMVSEVQADPAKASEILAAQLPDVMAAYFAVQKDNERRARARYVADLAGSFLHGVVETSESDGDLRDHAKRAVRLAELLLTEAGA